MRLSQQGTNRSAETWIAAIVVAAVVAGGGIWLWRWGGRRNNTRPDAAESLESGGEATECGASAGNATDEDAGMSLEAVKEMRGYRRTLAEKISKMSVVDRNAYLMSEIKDLRGKDLILAVCAMPRLMETADEVEWRPVLFELLGEYVRSDEGKSSRDVCAIVADYRSTTLVEALVTQAIRRSSAVREQAIKMMASKDSNDRAAGAMVMRGALMVMSMYENMPYMTAEKKKEDPCTKALAAMTEHLARSKDIPADCGRWITCGGQPERLKLWLGVLCERPMEEQRTVLAWIVEAGCFSEDVCANRHVLAVYKGTEAESEIDNLAERGAEASKRWAKAPGESTQGEE